MSENKPGFLYWKAIEPFWDKISIYDGPERFLQQLSTVPESIRHLFCTHWCHSEVSNGGFYQFYSNSTGILAPEALDGFLAHEQSGTLFIRSITIFTRRFACR